MKRQATPVDLSDRQFKVIKKLLSSKKIENRLLQRATIVYGAHCGLDNGVLSKQLDMKRESIAVWRNRWHDNQEKLLALEDENDNKKYYKAIVEILSDIQRPGAPATFTSEQICQIMALACEPPENSGYPVSHWSSVLLKDELIKRKIVETISVTQVGRFLKSGRH